MYIKHDALMETATVSVNEYVNPVEITQWSVRVLVPVAIEDAVESYAALASIGRGRKIVVHHTSRAMTPIYINGLPSVDKANRVMGKVVSYIKSLGYPVLTHGGRTRNAIEGTVGPQGIVPGLKAKGFLGQPQQRDVIYNQSYVGTNGDGSGYIHEEYLANLLGLLECQVIVPQALSFLDRQGIDLVLVRGKGLSSLCLQVKGTHMDALNHMTKHPEVGVIWSDLVGPHWEYLQEVSRWLGIAIRPEVIKAVKGHSDGLRGSIEGRKILKTLGLI